MVDLDDPNARLLAQALNRIEGQDDLGLKAELVRHVLESLPQNEVLSILPESTESLQALASLGVMDMSEHLQAWQQAQAAKLRHLTFQLTDAQLDVVEETLARALARGVQSDGSPNRRGIALAEICRYFLETMGDDD